MIMNTIISILLLAITAVIFTSFLRKDSPAIAMLITIAAGIAIVIFALDYIGQILNTLTGFLTAAGIKSEIYLPVIKAVGIAAVVRIASELCRDAGEGSLAAKLEMAGTAAAIWVCLPLFSQVLKLISSLIKL